MHAQGALTDHQFERVKNEILGLLASPTRQRNASQSKPNKAAYLYTAASPHTPAASPHTSKTPACVIGAHHTLKTCPVRSVVPKTVQSRLARYEKRTGEVARELIANGSPGGDEYFAAFLETAEGKRQFPETSACIRNDPHLQHLVKNVKFAFDSMGNHNVRIAIRLIGDGLPTAFLIDTVGMTDKQLGKRKVGLKNDEDPFLHSLCQQKYSDNVAREKITSVEISMLLEFFTKSTSVFSGTDRRCMEYTKYDWECKVTHTSRYHNQPSSQSSINHHITLHCVCLALRRVALDAPCQVQRPTGTPVELSAAINEEGQ